MTKKKTPVPVKEVHIPKHSKLNPPTEEDKFEPETQPKEPMSQLDIDLNNLKKTVEYLEGMDKNRKGQVSLLVSRMDSLEASVKTIKRQIAELAKTAGISF